uniref:hypothetical protein n=1 Tax=Paenarthrobacter nicotinovorans TaxID=29320 RepID=UPI003F492686
MNFEFKSRPTVPVVYKALHSENTKIAIQTPPTKGLKGDLRAAIGGGHVNFDREVMMYLLSNTHIETAVNYLADRFGSCEVQIMTSTVEKCTTSCQRAESLPVECECVCGGHHHGEGWPERWKLASSSGDLLVKGDRQIEFFTIHREMEAAGERPE